MVDPGPLQREQPLRLDLMMVLIWLCFHDIWGFTPYKRANHTLARWGGLAQLQDMFVASFD